MLSTLKRYQQDFNTSSQRCHNLGSSETARSHPQHSGSEFNLLAANVSEKLAQAIEAVDTQLLRINENTVQWEAADKLRTEFAQWLQAKSSEVEFLEHNAMKLHNDVAEHELAHLQVNMDTSKDTTMI